MLQKSETSRWAVIKYGIATLLIASLFVFVAACEDQSKKDVVSQQPITVSGQIIASDGKGVPGANIELKGSYSGTTTDREGRYQFAKVPANGTLIVSFVGHKKIEIPINNLEVINAHLAPTNGSAESSYWTSSKRPNAKAVQLPSTSNEKGPIFAAVENNPEFPGGMAALTQYMARNIQYPEAAKRALVSGRVFISFVINTDGSIEDINVLRGMGFGTDEEAVRVMKAMPRWKPGMQDGRPVRVRYNLPINFELTDKAATKSAFVESQEDGEMEPAFYEEVRREYDRFLVNGKSVSFEEYVKLDKYAYEGGFDVKNKTVSISVKMPTKP